MQLVKKIEDLKNITTTDLQVLNVGELKKERKRVDDKESREYLMITVGVKGDALGSQGKAKRNLFQSHNAQGVASWDIDVNAVVPGVELKGQIINFEVKPYFIPSDTGDSVENGVVGRWVTNYPYFIFEYENTPSKILSLLNATGRYLVDQETPESTTRAAIAPKESEQVF